MNLFSRLFVKELSKREKRVKIQHFHKIELLIEDQKYEISNISTSGLGIITDNKSFQPTKGSIIPAVVKIIDELCDISLEVVFTSSNSIGYRVSGACDVYKKFVVNYFNSELQALNLRAIDPANLAPNADGKPFWFHGDQNHEVFFTTVDHEITTYQINFHGYMVIMEPNGNVITGVTWDEDDELHKIKSSTLVKSIFKLPKDIMEFIYRFVETIEGIDSNHHNFLLKSLDNKFGKDWNK